MSCSGCNFIQASVSVNSITCNGMANTSILNPPNQPFIIFYINPFDHPIGATIIQHSCVACG